MPKNKVALVRGKAAELNAPLLSGYLEPGKQPYSFSRDSKRKSFHVIKKPSRGYNGLSCLGIRVVSLTVCVCVSGLLACCSFPILLWIKREASLSPRLLGLLMVLQDNKCSIELINHDRDPARSLYLFSQSFSTANTCFLACKSTCVLACSCHTRTTQSLKSGTATVCFFWPLIHRRQRYIFALLLSLNLDSIAHVSLSVPRLTLSTFTRSFQTPIHRQARTDSVTYHNLNLGCWTSVAVAAQFNFTLPYLFGPTPSQSWRGPRADPSSLWLRHVVALVCECGQKIRLSNYHNTYLSPLSTSKE